MSAADEPLQVRRRADLVVTQTGTLEHPIWTIKDPLSLQYFHLRPVDYFVWQQLDGAKSAVEIARQFVCAHAPDKLTPQQVLLFVQSLWKQGLVVVDQLGTVSGLLERQRRFRKNALFQQLSSVLAIRFRGFDPNWFLELLLPLVSWIFSPIVLLISVGLMLYAMVQVGTEWDVILREFPRFDAFLSVDRVLILGTTIAVIKILHELGHAFACKKFGGEVREIGVMLLALMPCLYCNVSDAWLLKSRWRRIAISGAGIYVELVIASLATIIWAWTVPGVVHAVCLYVMVVCSINTLFLNGNPLLRYDGYYILSDLVNVPNLRRRSSEALSRFAQRLLLRGVPARRRSSPWWHELGLILYGACSAVYLWVVLAGILWMLYQVFKPYGLESGIIVLGSLVVLLRLGTAGLQLVGFVRSLLARGQMKVLTTSTILAVLSYAVWWGFNAPLPRYVTSPLIILPADATTLFVSSPGKVKLTSDVKMGKLVQSQDVLATLQNHDIAAQIVNLDGQLATQRLRLQLLETQLSRDPDISAVIPTTQAQIRDLESRLNVLQQEAKRLQILAPQDGVLLSSELFSAPPGDLASREQPFQPRSDGAWLEAGAAICSVGSTHRRKALLYVDQAEVALLTLGTEVQVTTLQTTGRVLRGTITEISAKPVLQLPDVLAVSSRFPIRTGPGGQYTPIEPVHEVTVELQDDSILLPRQLGTASIRLASESAWHKIARSVRRTFTFDL